MRASAPTRAVAMVATLTVVLSSCNAAPDSHSSSQTAGTSPQQPAPGKSTTAATTTRAAPRDDDTASPQDTIASYIRDENIEETQVNRGDPDSPTIELPVPAGWKPAGRNTPDWAYDAIVRRVPDTGDYTPSIVAIVSKLAGNIAPQKIIDLAGGELQNLPGFRAVDKGTVSALGTYRAYQLRGIWQQDGQQKVVAQKTVVIPATNGLYVLQLNTDGLPDQIGILAAATDEIDSGTTIRA